MLLKFPKLGKVPNSTVQGDSGEAKNKLPLVGQHIPCSSPNPRPQHHATSLYPKPYKKFFMLSHFIAILILSSHLYLGLSSCLLLSSIHIKVLYVFICSPMRATIPTHHKTLDHSKLMKINYENVPR